MAKIEIFSITSEIATQEMRSSVFDPIATERRLKKMGERDNILLEAIDSIKNLKTKDSCGRSAGLRRTSKSRY